MPSHRNKIVRHLMLPTPHDRLRHLAEAGCHVGLLPSSAIYLDLLTDSGQAAMSDRQWAAMMTGDEAYAGSRSFAALEAAIAELFAMPFVVPAHQGRGAENLLVRALLRPGDVVVGNALGRTTLAAMASTGATFQELPCPEAWEFDRGPRFKGNLDLEALTRHVNVAAVWVAATSDPIGGQPISLSNLRTVSAWCRAHRVPLVLDASRAHENAWFIHAHETAGLSPMEIAREMAACANFLYLSGKKIGLSTIGGLVATRDLEARDRLRLECIQFEGMPFYGGMSGRDMAALAVGLHEAFDERGLRDRAADLAFLGDRLRSGGVPLIEPVGGHAVYLDLARWETDWGAHAAAAWLYAIGGIRAAALEPSNPRGTKRPVIRLAVPSRAYDRDQLAWAAQAVSSLYAQRDRLPALDLSCADELETTFPLTGMPSLQPLEAIDPAGCHSLPPYRGKVVEVLAESDEARRLAALEAAGYNMFLLGTETIGIDLFTDSGTNAMSDRAWAGMWQADESYRGSEVFPAFQAAVQSTYGYRHAFPTHQGRAAEAVLSEALISPDRPYIIGNQVFITTHGHMVRCGGRFIDVTGDPAFDLTDPRPFKGDVDLAKLESAIRQHGPERIAYLHLGMTVNSSGGQPIRMTNVRDVRAIAQRHGIPLYLDATRAVENAWFIQRQEPGYETRSLTSLLLELCSYSDGATISGKKDLIVNIGGCLALNDPEVARRAAEILDRIGGFPTSGGLAYRDLAAMTQGLRDMTEQAYMTHRIGLVRRLGEGLRSLGIPIVEPIGGHAVFVDAEAFLPHLNEGEHPGDALAAALFLESGVRAMKVKGTFQAGDTRRGHDLLRLCLPRRVYGPGHLDTILAAFERLRRRRAAIPGLVIAAEPTTLRGTLSRFRPTALARRAEG